MNKVTESVGLEGALSSISDAEDPCSETEVSLKGLTDGRSRVR